MGEVRLLREHPPTTADGLADYLAKENPDTRGSAYWTVDSLEALLREWTPGPAQTAAIDGLLAEQPGLRAIGPVRDRAGRQGQAYAADFKGTVRWTIILDEHTGRVLGTELSSIRTDPKMRLEPGDVEQYDAYLDWRSHSPVTAVPCALRDGLSADTGRRGLHLGELGGQQLHERFAAVHPEGADVTGEVRQGGEALGVRAEHRDTEQLHALVVLLGVIVLTPASEATSAEMRTAIRW